jgi:hypothetical protein
MWQKVIDVSEKPAVSIFSAEYEAVREIESTDTVNRRDYERTNGRPWPLEGWGQIFGVTARKIYSEKENRLCPFISPFETCHIRNLVKIGQHFRTLYRSTRISGFSRNVFIGTNDISNKHL